MSRVLCKEMAKAPALWKILLPTAAIAVLAVGTMTWVRSRVPDEHSLGQGDANTTGIPEGLKVGAKVPDFELFQLTGSPTTVGKVPAKLKIVNFWASWCVACVVEMPSLVKLREMYHDKGLEVIPVNMDQNPEKAMPPMLKKLGINFTAYVDRDEKLAKLFDLQALPMTVILDKDLKILLFETGERDWIGSEVRTQIERWLAN